jgi:hypothetical protein
MNLSPPWLEGSSDPLAPPVTVCVLCYGDYPELAKRVLGSLLNLTQKGTYRLRLGLNSVSAQTRSAIAGLVGDLDPELVIESDTNLYKSPMMRRLFYEVPLGTKWTVWFDDDSYVYRADWLQMLSWHSRMQPLTDMWGKRLYVRGNESYRQYIQEAAWFRGLELDIDPDDATLCRLNFIAGGFWAIRTQCLHEIEWPDARLLHFGDDYMLGEALRQNRKSLGQCYSGVAISQAKRRAPEGTPRCHVLH